LVIAVAPLQGRAVPPPPERNPTVVVASREEGARVHGEVRAYDAATYLVEVVRGAWLELGLEDVSGMLTLDVSSPSGMPLLEGARPGPDGMRLRVSEQGAWSIRVAMSADAARSGQRAAFALFLRTRNPGG
jgi:hypothetical protein